MNAFTELPAWKPLALFTPLLLFKMASLAFVTANQRRKSGVVLNPEDVGVNPGSHPEAQEAPGTLRAKRAHLNDLENIPAFLFMAVLFTLSGGSGTAGWAYFAFYFVVRTFHTICYLHEIQPWRTAAFALGQIALVGLVVQVVKHTFFS